MGVCLSLPQGKESIHPLDVCSMDDSLFITDEPRTLPLTLSLFGEKKRTLNKYLSGIWVSSQYSLYLSLRLRVSKPAFWEFNKFGLNLDVFIHSHIYSNEYHEIATTTINKAVSITSKLPVSFFNQSPSSGSHLIQATLIYFPTL